MPAKKNQYRSRITAYVAPEIEDGLKQIAAKQRRSSSNLVVAILTDYIENYGIRPKPDWMQLGKVDEEDKLSPS